MLLSITGENTNTTSRVPHRWPLIAADARVRVYRVHPAALQPVQNWLLQVEELWRGQLNSFKAYAEGSPRGRKAR